MIEAVPNFSEAVRQDVIESLVAVASSVSGVYLLDRTSDRDHNRTVLTLAGEAEVIQQVAVLLIGEAARRIDLRGHTGVHPRMGACDVMPFVPLEGSDMAECIDVAHAVGREVWRKYGVPSFFYEEAALSPDRKRLEEVRRGGFEGTSLTPDVGNQLHPSAGATIIGARKFLIAYNINLATGDLFLAQQIARKIRTSSGGFPAVKALGLELQSRNQVQVSMNLTDYETTSIDTVYQAVAQESQAAGITIAGSELIGLIPRKALPETDVRWENFEPSMVLENRLEAAIAKRPLN